MHSQGSNIIEGLDISEGKIINNLPHPYVMGLGIRTRDYETDAQGIINNANYLHYLEMTRHAFCMERGYSFNEMTADGLIAVLRKVEIEYIASLHGNELFLSCLWVERGGPRFLFHQDLFRAPDGAPVAKAVATVVVTENGHLTKGDTLARRLALEVDK